MINLAQKTISELSLHENTVELYFISVEKWRKEYSLLFAILDASEKIKAERFIFEKDRERYVIAHGLKWLVLSHLLGCHYTELNFYYTDNKKPHLVNNLLYFNLSHSGNWILLGVSQTQEIGVDIEVMESLNSQEAIMKRFFSHAEYRAYLALSPHEQQLGFYLAWTRKEAIVKAMGKGVSFGFNQFQVSLNPNQPAYLIAMNDKNWQEPWFLEGSLFLPSYTYAVACYNANNIKLSKQILKS